MTEPSRSSPEGQGTEIVSSGQLDPTLARPEGEVALPFRKPPNPEPEFGPPEKPGEVGTIGRYRVLKKLGQGGMGAVYLGFDVKLGRRVALKVMLPQHAADPESRERFLREARAVAMVRSDHVVTIFDVGEERGVAFIAMEYLLGSPLDLYLRANGELPLAQVLRIARETAVGLAAAHDLGLIHRDIKPGNIWLEAPKGRVKILDFGLARAQHEETQLTTSGLVVGTPAFMSPEQARGLKLDGRSDLFSLGVMLYRLITGKLPFDGSTTMAVLTSLAVDDPTPVRQVKPEVPPEFEAVISKLLAKKADDRYASAWDVLAALRDVDRPRPFVGEPPVVVEVVPLAIAAQSENVWEGIEASSSSPQVLESGAEVAPAPKAEWKKPPPNVSKVPLVLAGAALVAGVVLLAAVLLWPKKEPVVQNEPNEKRPTPVGKQPSAAPDPDRKGAEYVLFAGGALRINGEEREIRTAAELPKGRFELTSIALPANTHATDAGLAHFRDCKNLTRIHLWDVPVTDAGMAHFKGRNNVTSLFLIQLNVGDEGLANFKDCKGLTALDLGITQVSDAGLAHFKGCTNLEFLSLAGTRVSDAGLANFKDCKNLQSLNLDHVPATEVGLAHFKECENMRELQLKSTQANDAALEGFKGCKNLAILHLDHTQVSDEGLAHIKNHKQLTLLYLSGTKVTAKGVGEFAKAQPQCRIEWNGGVIEATAAAEPDRRAAEWVISVGGGVGLRGDPSEIRAIENLPKTPFQLVRVNLGGRRPVTDANLAHLKDCKSLTDLSLADCFGVTEAGLAHLKDQKDLVNLHLGNCRQVTDAGLAHFKDCKKLQMLAVYGCFLLTDAGLAHLKDCSELRHINLGYCAQVTDDGLAHFTKCSKLDHLNVHGCARVTDAGLASFRDCKDLDYLKVVGCPKVTAKGIEAFRQALPRCRIEWNGGVIEPMIDPDRRAAERVIALGGGVGLKGDPSEIKAKENLPKTPFQLTRVNLYQRRATDADLALLKDCKDLFELTVQECGDVTDAGLAHFKDHRELANLNIGFCPKVTDAGLAHFKDCKKFQVLALYGCPLLTDAGLAHFKDCPEVHYINLGNCPLLTDAGLAHFGTCNKLRYLNVYNCPNVTDAALPHFKGCKELGLLNVVRCPKVTVKALEAFHQALPRCRIEHDGGVIEPKK